MKRKIPRESAYNVLRENAGSPFGSNKKERKARQIIREFVRRVLNVKNATILLTDSFFSRARARASELSVKVSTRVLLRDTKIMRRGIYKTSTSRIPVGLPYWMNIFFSTEPRDFSISIVSRPRPFTLLFVIERGLEATGDVNSSQLPDGAEKLVVSSSVLV